MKTANKPRRPSRVSVADARIDAGLLLICTRAAELGAELRTARAHNVPNLDRIEHRTTQDMRHLAREAADAWWRYSARRKAELVDGGFHWPPPAASRDAAVTWWLVEWTHLYSLLPLETSAA